MLTNVFHSSTGVFLGTLWGEPGAGGVFAQPIGSKVALGPFPSIRVAREAIRSFETDARAAVRAQIKPPGDGQTFFRF
jgi:hypothetical protein